MHVKVLKADPELPSRELPESPGASESASNWEQPEDPKGTAALEAEVEIYRNILQRVVDVASEAANGNLEARLLHSDDADKSAAVSHAVNHLLDMTDAFLREAEATLEYAGEGKFFRRVLLRGMRGTFRHKSQLINEATAKMARNAASLKKVESLVSESANLSQDAVREAGGSDGRGEESGRRFRKNRRGGEIDFADCVANQASRPEREDRGEPGQRGRAGDSKWWRGK